MHGRIVHGECGKSRRQLCFGAIVACHLIAQPRPRRGPEIAGHPGAPSWDVIEVKCKEKKKSLEMNEGCCGEKARMSHPQFGLGVEFLQIFNFGQGLHVGISCDPYWS
jgi:hypothetical protein